jgi:1-acyl-sn-glycerol-3-phosphate acyltransferase
MREHTTLTAEFQTPLPVQFKGNRLAAWLVKLMGWRISFNGLPSLQGVIIGYPHTSNWDFVVVMPVKWALGLPVQFFAKDSLFRIPVFGRWLKSLGGMAIDRSSSRGVVGEMVNTLQQHKKDDRFFWVGLSPEGTRKRTQGWKSGFYQLALQAEVPLGFLVIDYGKKTISIDTFMRLSGNPNADYQRFAEVYEGVTGCHAQQASPIQPLKPLQPLQVSQASQASQASQTSASSDARASHSISGNP